MDSDDAISVCRKHACDNAATQEACTLTEVAKLAAPILQLLGHLAAALLQLLPPLIQLLTHLPQHSFALYLRKLRMLA